MHHLFDTEQSPPLHSLKDFFTLVSTCTLSLHFSPGLPSSRILPRTGRDNQLTALVNFTRTLESSLSTPPRSTCRWRRHQRRESFVCLGNRLQRPGQAAAGGATPAAAGEQPLDRGGKRGEVVCETAHGWVPVELCCLVGRL